MYGFLAAIRWPLLNFLSSQTIEDYLIESGCLDEPEIQEEEEVSVISSPPLLIQNRNQNCPAPHQNGDVS
jgi:hypothetical protein